MKIIGFSGRKQSGKTTAAEFLQKRTQGEIQSFAAGLKLIVWMCFDDRDIDDVADDPNALYITPSDKDKLLPCGQTPRSLMQKIGTDWFRQIDNDCWIRVLKKVILKDGIEPVIVPDVRFPNEVKCIQDLGGHVIRLLRAPFEDKHESETALNKMEQKALIGAFLDDDRIAVARSGISEPHFDAVIDNREMTIEQQNEAVWKLVTEKGWI